VSVPWNLSFTPHRTQLLLDLYANSVPKQCTFDNIFSENEFGGCDGAAALRANHIFGCRPPSSWVYSSRLVTRHLRVQNAHGDGRRVSISGSLLQGQTRKSAPSLCAEAENIKAESTPVYTQPLRVYGVPGAGFEGAQGARAPGLPPTGGLPPNPSYFFVRDMYMRD